LTAATLHTWQKRPVRRFDEAGLDYVKIAASNQLDEHVIKSLNDQDAPVDLFGVGTSLVIGRPDAALDGVYKLSYANGKPRIKLSESIGKITLPHKKQVYRIINDREEWMGADAVAMEDEKDFKNIHSPFEPGKSMNIECCKKVPLLEKVMENGKRTREKLPSKRSRLTGKKEWINCPGSIKGLLTPMNTKSESATD
jgi:nicotinate phosphoribosyltransferase